MGLGRTGPIGLCRLPRREADTRWRDDDGRGHVHDWGIPRGRRARRTHCVGNGPRDRRQGGRPIRAAFGRACRDRSPLSQRDGRGRTRRGSYRPAAAADQPPDRRHLARLGCGSSRLRSRRRRGSLRRRRRPVDPVQERRARPLQRRHGKGRPRQVADGGRPRDGGGRRGRGRRRIPRPRRDQRIRPGAALPKSRRGDVGGDNGLLGHHRRRQRAVGRVRRPGRGRRPRPLRRNHGRLLAQDAGSAVRRQRRRRESPVLERRQGPLYRRRQRLGALGHDALDAVGPFSGLRPGRPRGPARHQRLRPQEPVSQRRGQALRGRRQESRGIRPRVRNVGSLGGFRWRRPSRPLHHRHGHAVVLPPRVSGDSDQSVGTALSFDGHPLVRGDGFRQHAAPPAPGPHVRERHLALGRAARRLELERGRRRSRRRRLARCLLDQRHVGRRPRPRRRARVLVADPGVLGRLRGRDEDVRPQGRRHRGDRARPLLPQPGRRRGGRSAVRGPRVPGRPGSRDQRPRRRGVRRRRRRSARSVRPLGSGARSLLPGIPKARGALSPHPPRGHSGRRQPRRDRRPDRGEASGRPDARGRKTATPAAICRREARSFIWAWAASPAWRGSRSRGRRAASKRSPRSTPSTARS